MLHQYWNADCICSVKNGGYANIARTCQKLECHYSLSTHIIDNVSTSVMQNMAFNNYFSQSEWRSNTWCIQLFGCSKTLMNVIVTHETKKICYDFMKLFKKDGETELIIMGFV